MNFKPLFLYAETETGTDILGNVLKEMTLLWESEGFFSNWNNRELAADDITIQSNKRSVTVDNRKIITPCKREWLEKAVKVKLDGKYYDITAIEGDDHLRWRVIIVNRYGTDAV